jgi:hypothetical protein
MPSTLPASVMIVSAQRAANSWPRGEPPAWQMGLPTNGQLKNWRGGKPADGCVRDPECTFDA